MHNSSYAQIGETIETKLISSSDNEIMHSFSKNND